MLAWLERQTESTCTDAATSNFEPTQRQAILTNNFELSCEQAPSAQKERSQGPRERDAKTTSHQSRGKRRQDCYRIRVAWCLEWEKRSYHSATQNAAEVDESSNACDPSTSVKHAATKSRRLSVEQQNEDDDGSK